MLKSLLFARNRSRCLSGGNVTFGSGRTNGERIRDQRLYGVDAGVVQNPYSYDNEDVPEFVVDPACNYNVEPRRNLVRSGKAQEVASAPPSSDEDSPIVEPNKN